jgi:hypothetical protein
LLRDGVIAGTLFLVAVIIGWRYVDHVIASGGLPRFYQDQFGAAVMRACGHGYVGPDDERVPALHAFLQLETRQLSCASLPAQVPTEALTSMQVAFRYQLESVAAVWRWRGVGWNTLGPLYGVFYGATIALSYAVFRLGAGRVLAALLSLALACSTLHLIYLPHFRDYSKAPFVLAVVLLLAVMMRSAAHTRRLLMLAAAYGIVVGIGVGFRNDLLIALPPFVAVVAFFLPGPLTARLIPKAGAIAICLTAFAVTISPMWSLYRTGGGNGMSHVTLLGFVAPFDASLGVTTDGLYEWGHAYKDDYVRATVDNFAHRIHQSRQFLELYGVDYDRYAEQYRNETARTFPADMLVRLYASALNVMALPYNATSVEPPTYITDAALRRLYRVRESVLRTLGSLWLWTVPISLAVIAARNVRAAILLLGALIYLAGYPALQFDERHYFHLEFLPWAALGFFLQTIGMAGYRLWQQRAQPRSTAVMLTEARRAVVPVAVVAAALLALWAPLAALRAYQQPRVKAMLARYLAAEREPIAFNPTREDAERTMFRMPLAAEDEEAINAPVTVDYVVAEFAAGACELLKLDVTFQYFATEESFDFSRTVQVRPPLDAGVTRLFFPAYAHPPRPGEPVKAGFGLRGIVVPAAAEKCLTGLSRVRHPTMPLLLSLHLPPAWEEATLYQTIVGVESRSDGSNHPNVFTDPPEFPVTRSLATAAVRGFSTDNVAEIASTVEYSDGTWTARGVGGVGGRGPFLYLVRMQPAPAAAGSFLLARGYLEEGGISVGLVRNGKWEAQVAVTEPGEFVAIAQAPSDGEYSVVVANNLQGPSLYNNVVIRRLGWVTDAP